MLRVYCSESPGERPKSGCLQYNQEPDFGWRLLPRINGELNLKLLGSRLRLHKIGLYMCIYSPGMRYEHGMIRSLMV